MKKFFVILSLFLVSIVISFFTTIILLPISAVSIIPFTIITTIVLYLIYLYDEKKIKKIRTEQQKSPSM